eukprot:6463128-Amphidinium_carterae.4
MSGVLLEWIIIRRNTYVHCCANTPISPVVLGPSASSSTALGSDVVPQSQALLSSMQIGRCQFFCKFLWAKLRSAITDQAGSNVRVLQTLAIHRGGWQNLHHFCDSYIIASIHTNTLDALVQKCGEVTIGCENWDLKPVCKGLQAIVLQMVLQEQSQPMLKHMLLLRVLSGDWRLSNSVEHLVMPGLELPSCDAVLAEVEQALLMVFASSKPRTSAMP